MPVLNMTEQEFSAHLDQQIDALLRKDWSGFAIAGGCDPKKVDIVNCHSDAWYAGGWVPGGLFAFLPNCLYCASSIEVNHDPRSREEKLKDFLLAESPMRLLPVSGNQNQDMTLAELQEFKRRQLKVHYDPNCPV